MSPLRITLVANELRGCVPCGGLGTTTTSLALALCGLGHRVEILYFGPSSTPPSAGWGRIYEDAGIRIRMVPRGAEKVEPAWFADCRDVETALRDDPPDLVIAQDGAAPAYTALRLRQLGLDFQSTRFVVICHGTRGWIKEVSRNVRVFPHLLHLTTLERASIEIADAVVSPSAYLVEWMRRQEWRLPERTRVIPHPTTGTARDISSRKSDGDRTGGVERIVVFGRLDERKGIRPLVAAVNALDIDLLGRIELEFLGAAIPMKVGDVDALLADRTKSSLRRLAFVEDLDQPEALQRLSRPGTLAVMPSLEDNSPNTVYECLELGIPFIASDRGGTSELIAPEDRARVLFEPTAEAIEAALRRALADGEALRPARAAFDEQATLRAWTELLSQPVDIPRPAAEPAVDVVVCLHGSSAGTSRSLRALAHQEYPSFRVLVAAASTEPPDLDALDGLDAVLVNGSPHSPEDLRQAGLEAATAPWVVLLDGDDLPDPELLQKLVRAQAASGADVVSCGLRVEADSAVPTLRLFSGDPGGLGVLGNDYGQVALLRRAILSDVRPSWPVEDDPNWPLLAAVRTSGAEIVSIPSPLVTRHAHPGLLARSPSDALLVVQELEGALPHPLRSLSRLAAGLAADATVRQEARSPGAVRSIRAVLRDEGVFELLRRIGRRSLRLVLPLQQ